MNEYTLLVRFDNAVFVKLSESLSRNEVVGVFCLVMSWILLGFR